MAVTLVDYVRGDNDDSNIPGMHVANPLSRLIDIHDVRIGNHIYFKGYEHKIEMIELKTKTVVLNKKHLGRLPMNKVIPIEITAELLEKRTMFRREEESPNTLTNYLSLSGLFQIVVSKSNDTAEYWNIGIVDNGNRPHPYICATNQVRIKWLHQLENIFYFMSGFRELIID
jgi:hypothetical protein